MLCHFAEVESDGMGCFVRRLDTGAAIIVETGLIRLCVQIGLVCAITEDRDFDEEHLKGLSWFWHRKPFDPGSEFSRETYDALFDELSPRQSEVFLTVTNQVLFFVLMHELGHLRFGHLGMLADKALRPEMKDGGQNYNRKNIDPAVIKGAEIDADRYGYYQSLQASLLAPELRADFTWLNSIDRINLLNYGLLQLFTVWMLWDMIRISQRGPQ